MGEIVEPGSVQVEAIELIRVRLPYRRPWRASHGVETHRDSTIVRWLGADGAEGWGECPALTRPSYDETYADGEWRVLADLLVPARLAGQQPVVVGHHPARSALECAAVDAVLRARGRGLSEHLGGDRRRVPAMAVLPRSDDAGTLLAEVERALAAGYEAVSLKVVPDDLDAVAAVRRELPDLRLAIDANGSLAAADPGVLTRLGGLGLEWVEQPVAATDLVGAAAFRSRCPVPIALDEPLQSVGSLATAAALGALDIANLKPARLGGLDDVRAAHALGRRQGLRLLCGGMMECGIGRAFALAVASLPGFTEPTHLGPSDRYFGDDLVAPVELGPDGMLPVPDGPGLGVEPRPAALDRYAVDRLLLRP